MAAQTTIKKTGAVLDDQGTVQTTTYLASRHSKRLYFHELSQNSMLSELRKETTESGSSSNQGTMIGEIPHPVDYEKLPTLQDVSPHHAVCLAMKADSTVGLGFTTGDDIRAREESIVNPLPNDPVARADTVYEPSIIDETLDPMCLQSWADTIYDVCHDFYNYQNGYIEVVREGTEIKSLFHINPKDITVVVEGDGRNYHYRVRNPEATVNGASEVDWPRFGDKQAYLTRAANPDAQTLTNGFQTFLLPPAQEGTPAADRISEVIHIRRPSARCRWYGYPDWLAVTPAIELVQSLQQYNYDFFNNRGVPEFMLFVTGAKLSKEDWEKVEQAIQANMGYGNSHRTFALNIGQQEVSIQVERLNIESGGEEKFAKTKESLNLDIVTGHRVPPMLAGIQIPGKLGGNNEIANALLSFQLLVISPAQREISRMLQKTLGGSQGVPALLDNRFNLRQLTDMIDPSSLDTVSRMRQSLPAAAAEGRDLAEGMRD